MKKNFNTKEITGNEFYDVRNRDHRTRADEKDFKKLSSNVDYSNDDYNPTLNEIAKRPPLATKFNQHRKRHSNRLYNRGKPGLARHNSYIN